MTEGRPVTTAHAHTLPDFLSVPGRPPKPRQTGITHVIDKGMSVRQLEDMLEVAGDVVCPAASLIKIAVALDATARTWEGITRRSGKRSQLVQWTFLKTLYPQDIRSALV